MAGSMYQYGTSPRKIQPEYNPRRKQTNKKKTKQTNKNSKKIKAKEKQRMEQLKKEKKIHYQNIAIIISMFLVLLTISYRNSLITEKFNQIQNKKQELSAIEKSNGQTEISIESSLNLKSLEKNAKKQLGMQKLDKDQKVYVTLPKKDYTESALPEVETENSSNWLKNIFTKLFK
ncbi:MAG: hypothetical protein IJK18_06880 [Clostridia bacterium]|nr:hypothetical protein [Clostridia bacterium]